MFDYNLDFFELGALDDPTWKLENPEVRYIKRAASARAGLWGNHGYEAAYAMTYKDADGHALDGDHSYRLRFAPTRRSAPSGRSQCTTCPTSTSSPTPSTGTPSETAHPGSSTVTTGP